MMKTKLVKSITSSLLFACALVSLVAAMALGTCGTARAALGPLPCGLYTLRGSYLFATHGWNIVSGVAVPKAIVEGIDFNGDGTLVSPFATVSINGTIIHSSGSLGTYTVNTDCTRNALIYWRCKLRHIRRAERQAAVDDPDRSNASSVRGSSNTGSVIKLLRPWRE